MRIMEGLAQRSPEWVSWRACGIGSSDAAAVMGASPWTSRAALLKEKRNALRGTMPPYRDNSSMARGRRLEPSVLAWFVSFYGAPMSQPCAQDAEMPFIRASFDAWSGENGGWVAEIKCPKDADHCLALGGQVPDHYWPQCAHLALVSGCSRFSYVSYSDRFARGKAYAVVPLEFSQAELDGLRAAEAEFWDEVLRGAPAPAIAT